MTELDLLPPWMREEPANRQQPRQQPEVQLELPVPPPLPPAPRDDDAAPRGVLCIDLLGDDDD